MRDVKEWLEQLGLAKYAELFVQNEVDLEALPHLTSDMLTQMGLPVGPRAKLLAAIAALQLPPAKKLAQAAGLNTESPMEPPQAERRQITILFADLADSTKLAASLDPEDLRALMVSYQRACEAVITRYAGHVAQYLGDGIVVYFGWPSAQEDAAERAVRAGLDVVEAVKALSAPEALSVRVGINSGTVVISDTGHGDPSVPLGAVGATPHIAARLQSLAGPNAVVISSSTSRLVGALCEQEDLGLHDLKGVADPMHVFGVKRMHTSRFLASRARTLTPFVGRQAELALLQQRWHDAREGEGQVAYVSGVPGIGKSRIVYELEQSIRTEARYVLKFHCSPHGTQSALFPIIHGLAWQAKLNAGDPPAIKLAKIKVLLAMSMDDIDSALPIWAEMFSVPLEPSIPRRARSSQQAKDQTLFLLADVLVGLSRRAAIFCLLEDAQWIDPSTHELLDLIAGRIERARVLFVVTHRPEYQPHVGDHGNVSTLAISRLARRDMMEMTWRALHEQAVSAGVVQRIIEDSDAIPLFVEELARGVVEAGESSGPSTDAAPVEPAPAASSVPDSLRDSLVARLDKVPLGRRVAQIAAVIGREFSYGMLLQVSALDDAELEPTVSYLIHGEIVHQIEREPVPRFAFTHALLRDVAYESLLKSTRREIHARVAAALERAPAAIVAQPELLAYHYGQAGQAEAAVRYWLAGGRLARSRWANLEAIGQLQSALEFVKQLPNAAERAATELEIQLTLGLSFIAVRGYSSSDTRHAYERASELAAQCDDPERTRQALFGLWGHFWMTAQHDRAIELAQALLAQARSLDEPQAQSVAHRSLGSTYFTLGKFVEAADELRRAMALIEREDVPARSSLYAVDPRIAAQLVLGWDLWMLGFPDQALANTSQALERALASGDPYSIAFAHYVRSAVHSLRGEAEEALEHATHSLVLSTQHRIDLYAVYSRFGRGCALAMMGEAEEGLVDIRDGIDGAERSNLGYMRGFMLGSLASVQMQLGDVEAARSTVEGALGQVDDIAGRAWEAELHRLRGELLEKTADAHAIAPDDRDPVHCYAEAIAIAERQGARSLQLRASISLAELWDAAGSREQARALLAPIYGWFTEGFTTADLVKANALLEKTR